MSSWSLASIPWQRFDSSKVDPKLLAQAKGASLVESNAADYVAYLGEIFAGNGAILADVEEWGKEEELHGAALRKWCEMADPAFDYASALARFKSVYHLPPAELAVRGSPAQELVSRCVVETGTTTYYTAMRDACEEPVLKEICRRIAGDEVRHFNLFLRHLTGEYAGGGGRLERLKTVLERVMEVDDPELTFAHFTANLGAQFDARKFPEYAREYMAKTVEIYRPRHFAISAPMLAKAIGVSLSPRVCRWIGGGIYRVFRCRYSAAPSVSRPALT